MSTSFTVPIDTKDCIDVLSKELNLKFKPVENKGYSGVIVGAYFLYLFGLMFWSLPVFNYSITIWSHLLLLSSMILQYSPELSPIYMLIPPSLVVGYATSLYLTGVTIIFITILTLAWCLTRKIFRPMRFRFTFIPIFFLSLPSLFSHGTMTNKIHTIGFYIFSSCTPLSLSQFTVLQLHLFLLANEFSDLSVFMMKLGLFSLILLPIGLMLLNAGTKRISNAIEKDKKGIFGEYAASVALKKMKVVRLGLLMNPSFKITLNREKNKTRITVDFSSYLFLGLSRRYRTYSRYFYSRYFYDEAGEIAYNIRVALERWYSSQPPSRTPSSDQPSWWEI